MKKIFNLLYLIVFFGICCIPVFTMPFINESAGERENVHDFPEVLIEGSLNENFFAQFDEYLSENFSFRNIFIKLNTDIFQGLLGAKSSNQVIIGDQGWLYFDKTLDDYQGINVLTDKQIKQISNNLNLMKQYVNSKGCEFLFVIAPNKNSIVDEYMPNNYIKTSADTNAKLLQSSLDSEIYVDLFDVLRSSNETEQIYLKKDSHWNNLGASIAFDEILKKLNIEKTFELSNKTLTKDFESDLQAMLTTSSEKNELDEQVYFDFDTEYEFIGRYKGVDDFLINTTCKTGKGKAIVFRDSFSNALLDFFAHQFNVSQLSRVIPYTVDLASDYDYMIIEIVERNIPNLLTSAPIMPAPLTQNTDVKKSENPEIIVEQSGNYQHVYGYIKDSVSSSIYIKSGDTLYQAFQVFESSLELDSYDNLNGFSAYIPLDAETENLEIVYS